MAAQRFWQTSCGLAIGHPWHWRATDLGEAWQGRLLQCICQAWERHGWVIKAKQDHGPPEGMSIAQAMVHGYVFWRPKACPHSLWTKVPWSNVFKLYLLCWCLFANCYPDPNQHFGFCLLAFEVWSSSTGSKASLSQCWSPWRVWHRRGWVAWGLNSEHCKGMPHGSIWWMHCSLAAIGFICCSLNFYFCRWLRFVTSIPGKTM